MSEDSIYNKEFCLQLLDKIERLEKNQASPDSLSLTAQDRPSDSTTIILRAWLAFMDVLFRYGTNAELTINNVEIARLFALDVATFRKLLNPIGNKTIDYYTSMDRQTFINQAKALPEKLLLAHETTLLNNGRQYDVYRHVTPVEYPNANTSGYNVGTPVQEYSHGYNTAHDNYMRGETPDNT